MCNFIFGGVHMKYILILGSVRYHCPTGKSVFLSESVYLKVYFLSGVDCTTYVVIHSFENPLGMV